MHVVRSLILFLLIVNCSVGWSQSVLPDSVNAALASKTSSADKIDYLHQLSTELFRSDPSLNYDLLNKALQLAQSIDDDTLLIDTKIKLGIYYLYSDSQDSALNLYTEALQQIKKLNDSTRLATIYSEIGIYYYRQSNDPLALENFVKSYKIAEVMKDIPRLAGLSNNIGNVYRYLGDMENAKEFTLKAIFYKNELKDSTRMASSYHNLGITYDMLGRVDSALYYFKLSEWYKFKFNNVRGLASTYVSLSEVFNKKGNTDSAFFYLDKAIALDQQLNYSYGLGYDLNSRGRMHYEAGNFKLALDDVRKALNIAEDARLIKDATMLLSDIYEQLNDYKNAALYRKRYAAFADSVNQVEKEASLQEMQVKFETDLKDSEIAQLEGDKQIQDLQAARERQFRLFLIILVTLLIVTAVVTYYNYRIKLKANVILDEQNRAKSKLFTIISHDLKNPVAAFRNMSEGLADNLENLSKDKIGSYLSKMGANAIEVENQLNELLIWASQQLKKEEIKTESVEIKPLVEQVMALVSPLSEQRGVTLNSQVAPDFRLVAHPELLKTVLRNIVTNALKFTESGGLVELVTTYENGRPVIKIKDTGIGMRPEELELLLKNSNASEIKNHANKGTGLGFSLIKDIMDKLNGQLSVDSEHTKGTTFTLSF